MPILDNRASDKNLAAKSRKKFLDRYKESIKESVDLAAGKKTLKDIGKYGETVKKHKGDLKQPTFTKDETTGTHKRVLTGNDRYSKGDLIPKPSSGKGKGNKGGDKSGPDDSFSFTLTKEEFLKIYFSGMELPDFVKKNLLDSETTVRKKAGYMKDGPPPRLNYMKTILEHIKRQVATKGKIDKNMPLDEIDLVYNRYKQVPIPDKKAVMFALMDVSGSMDDWEKMVSKKFFFLLYLFLEKEHTNVDIVFIRHTEEACEVDEHTFFYSKESGGTMTSSGINLILKIIKERYSQDINIYVAHASDGDNFRYDRKVFLSGMTKLLPLIQYYAYVQVETTYSMQAQKTYKYETELWTAFKFLLKSEKSKDILNIVKVGDEKDVYPVLHKLFKKRGN